MPFVNQELPRDCVKPPLQSLNRRHCGQSQRSCAIRQKERISQSKVLGNERKKLAPPKKSARKSK